MRLVTRLQTHYPLNDFNRRKGTSVVSASAVLVTPRFDIGIYKRLTDGWVLVSKKYKVFKLSEDQEITEVNLSKDLKYIDVRVYSSTTSKETTISLFKERNKFYKVIPEDLILED